MKQFILSCALLLFCLTGHTQILKGVITDGETFLALPGVIVLDLATGQSATSGPRGYFELNTRTGNKLSCSLNGYHNIERMASLSDTIHIELLPITVNLPEYTLHELTQFQKDSIEMEALYHKELTTKPIKTGFSSANGGGFTGLIGGPVQRMSKSYKQNKKFKETFRKDIEQKFIDTKYKPELVTSLTGLKGDSLVVFMNTHPMDYSFARAATDLEIKAWIRDSYKEYIKP